MNHIERVHLRIKAYECQFCNKKFRQGISKSHRLGQCKKTEELTVKCEELMIKCEHCNFLSDNQSILKLHALSHQISLVDIMKNLPPSIKEASFNTEDEFLADLKIFFDNSSVGNSEFESSNLKQLTVECKECEKRFSSKKGLREHLKDPHNGLKVECKECGKTFSSKKCLREHLRNTHSGLKVDCKNCGKKLKAKHISRHMRDVHNENSGEKKCSQCDFTSLQANTFRTHLKTHTGEKRNKCNQCNYASANTSNLRRHLKTHSGEKPNKCNQCDYASSEAGDLRRHLKKHSGEKPNKCNQCDYASSEAGKLRRHLKKHSGAMSNKLKL